MGTVGRHAVVVLVVARPDSGVVRVRDRAGAILRSWAFGARHRGSVTWDGRRPGAVVADGRYTFEVDGRTPPVIGPSPGARSSSIGRSRSVTWSDGSFDPRAGQKSRASVLLRRAAVITVGIYRGSTLIRRVWTGTSVGARTYTYLWDGRTRRGPRDAGHVSHPRARHELGRDDRGIRARSRSSPIERLDALSPLVSLRTDGRRTGAGRGDVGRPAHLRRGREHRPDLRRHPRGALPGRDAARRRRRLARRHRRAWPTSSPRPTPAIRVRHRAAKQGLGRAYLDGFADRARWRRRDRRPDGRRLQPRPRPSCRR